MYEPGKNKLYDVTVRMDKDKLDKTLQYENVEILHIESNLLVIRVHDQELMFMGKEVFIVETGRKKGL